MEPAEIPSKFELGDLERSRSTGEDLEIVLCGCSVYHENELTMINLM
jgi:hypothetical protein